MRIFAVAPIAAILQPELADQSFVLGLTADQMGSQMLLQGSRPDDAPPQLHARFAKLTAPATADFNDNDTFAGNSAHAPNGKTIKSHGTKIVSPMCAGQMKLAA